MRLRRSALVGGLALLGALRVHASVAPSCWAEAGAETCVDRGELLPSGRTAVEVSRLGRRFPAEVGAEAIVLGRPTSSDVEVVKRASVSLDAWVVRSLRPGEDGVALTQRLVAEGQRATVDLWLPRFPAAGAVPPNDSQYGGQWYLQTLRIEGAWRLSQGKPEVVVAVIDDGCDATHPELHDKLLPGRDVIDGDDDPTPPANRQGNNHGTSCAGLVAAQTNNARGIAGACPECRLRCIRMVGGRGVAVPIDADVNAFDFALSTGVDVVSNSWSYGPSTPVPSLVAQAMTEVMTRGRGGRGAVVVFAAGNDDNLIGADQIAAVPGVISVGAINNFDEAAPFSNHGPSLSVTAPTGTFTLDLVGPDGASPGDYTDSFGGTSSACPLVSGIAGLVLSARPDYSPADVKALLETTARPAPYARPDAMGHDQLYGFGIVDPTKALERALGLSTLDGGADAGTGQPNPQPPKGCGCSTGDATAGVLLALLAAAARRRALTYAGARGPPAQP